LKKLARILLNKLGETGGETRSAGYRSRVGSVQGWISILVNVLLFLIKGVLGVLTGSLALIADAVHTLSDILSSAVIVISFRIAKKPSDATHPFGHGRIEAVATLIVSILLVVAGIELFREAVERILRPRSFEAAWWLIGVIAVTILVKEMLARFADELSHRIHSAALHADSWHHRSDAVSSLLVILAFLGQRAGLAYIDGIAGLGVSFLIIYTGWTIAREGVDDLLGAPPPARLVDQIKSAVLQFPDILDVHDLIVHQYGQTMVLSFHIVISDEHSLADAHSLAEDVEHHVNSVFHTYCTVHLDPINIRDPDLKKIREFLKEILDAQPCDLSFHDLRMNNRNRKRSVSFDLVVCLDMDDREIDKLIRDLKHALIKTFPFISQVVIEVEPKYAL
jgi:cation diffusion facilitator family transporter